MKYTKVIAILIVLVGIGCQRASAATVFVESSRDQISVGDSVVISVKINAEGEVINTIDGNISIEDGQGKSSVKEFSLANSVFGMWPRTPSLDSKGKLVSFVGGVPGGMSIENATVFKFVLTAVKEGTIKISPKDTLVFLNDNKGTQTTTKLKGISIKINPKTVATNTNDWQDIVVSDKIPPEKFIIVLGQDQKIYDGKIFAYFSALDNQSGIDHYEVIENSGKAVRSGSVYIPNDQSGKLRLKVTAFDKAGNTTVAYYPNSSKPVAWGWVIIIVVLGLFARFVYKIKNARKNNYN